VVLREGVAGIVVPGEQVGSRTMAIGVYVSPVGMSTEKYDECIKLLRKAGAGHPNGRTYHVCFGPSNNLSVFDVWSSQAAFDKFGKTLMPIMQQIGVDAGQPQVVPIHKVITRPKAAPAAKKKRPASKPASRRVAKKVTKKVAKKKR
jgi:hypothetical protein